MVVFPMFFGLVWFCICLVASLKGVPGSEMGDQALQCSGNQAMLGMGLALLHAKPELSVFNYLSYHALAEWKSAPSHSFLPPDRGHTQRCSWVILGSALKYYS